MTRDRRMGLLCLAAGLACGSSTEPEEGTYRLHSLRHTPVPYVDTLGCCTYTGGRLALDAQDYDLRLYFQNNTNALVDTAFERGTYTARGDSLAFTPLQGNYPLSLSGAVRQRDTLRLALGGDGPGASDQFPAVFIR
ncbi:MAG: hypothetical protein IPJ95_10525 [Gemmatimonadetes bacterium]|nr:hypothetical protein [Gemmatimonadota bacterium]